MPNSFKQKRTAYSNSERWGFMGSTKLRHSFHANLYSSAALVFAAASSSQFAKSFTELGGVLFDDAGERNDVNHASHIVPFSVFQRERHGSEGFAAAGKDGERKQPLRLCGLIDGMIRNFATQAV